MQAKDKKNSPKVSWKAPEFVYIQKGKDWYWVLWIITFAGATLSALFENYIFSVFLILASFVLSLLSVQKPRVIDIAVTPKKIKLDKNILDLEKYNSYNIIAGDNKILLSPVKRYKTITVIPLGENVSINQLEKILRMSELEEDQNLTEPFLQLLFEKLGF